MQDRGLLEVSECCKFLKPLLRMKKRKRELVDEALSLGHGVGPVFGATLDSNCALSAFMLVTASSIAASLLLVRAA